MNTAILTFLFLAIAQVLCVPIAKRDAALTIVNPTLGESWPIGNTQVINWTTDSNAPIDLVLMKGSEQVQSIVQGLNGIQGSYLWAIPSNVEPSTEYQVAFVSNGQALSTSPAFTLTLTPTATPNEIPPPTTAADLNHWTATANITLSDSQGNPKIVNQNTSAANALAPALSSLIAIMAALALVL
ncbi:hypothetical protein BC940DRAFT_319170 [Gongronella butleri]|nr:hypothetical protein BC940DRAFT_319170 [Gongronella butleri]